MEWQADFYASCLLMPRKMIFAMWDEFFPDRKQRVLQPETPVAHSFVEIPRVHVGTSIEQSAVLGELIRQVLKTARPSPSRSAIRRSGRGDGSCKMKSDSLHVDVFSTN